MTAEADFHRKRKAFIILDAGILMARDGFEKSHIDMLRQSGFPEDQANRLIETQPRGFVLDGNLYFYQGMKFHRLSGENKEKASSYIFFFRSLGLLPEDGKVYDGMHIGEAGEKWQPISEF